jgi:hypothetical protein
MEQFYYFDIKWHNEDGCEEHTEGFVTANNLVDATIKLVEDYDCVYEIILKEASKFRGMTLEELTEFLTSLLPENTLEDICGTQVQMALENLRAATKED